MSVSGIGFSITLVIVLLGVLGGLTAAGHVAPVPDRGIELATATAQGEGRP